MSNLKPLWQQLGFSSEQDKADYENKMLGTSAPDADDDLWLECGCGLPILLDRIHICNDPAPVGEQAVGDEGSQERELRQQLAAVRAMFSRADVEIERLDQQLAAARAEIERLKGEADQRLLEHNVEAARFRRDAAHAQRLIAQLVLAAKHGRDEVANPDFDEYGRQLPVDTERLSIINEALAAAERHGKEGEK